MLEDPLRTHGWRDTARIRERVLKVMGEVGLPAELYEELPLGPQRGAATAQSMSGVRVVLEPEILIMDETLSTLGS